MCSMRVAKHNGRDKQCVSGMSAPVGGHVGCGGRGFCSSAPQYKPRQGGEEGHTHTHTHTQEHAQERTREGDEDSNFSIFSAQPFTEWPGPLH